MKFSLRFLLLTVTIISLVLWFLVTTSRWDELKSETRSAGSKSAGISMMVFEYRESWLGNRPDKLELLIIAVDESASKVEISSKNGKYSVISPDGKEIKLEGDCILFEVNGTTVHRFYEDLTLAEFKQYLKQRKGEVFYMKDILQFRKKLLHKGE